MKKEAILRNLFEISRLTHKGKEIDENTRVLITIYLENLLDIFDSLIIEMEKQKE